jgi:hypothetical protein
MKPFAYRFAIALAATFALTADDLVPATPHVRPLNAKSGARPFTYMEAPDKLPNYLAGEKWGTQRQAITQMQAPLSPEESAKRFVVQPGFTTSLFAAEPDIDKPIALAWDERGRLWVAETADYPNKHQPEGQGRDRIKICKDTDGDGKADKFTVFADKLSIPTSLCFGNGGLIVIEGGHTLFLKDTDGGDKSIVPALQALVSDRSADALGLNAAATHTLWTLQGLGAVGREAVAALNHPSARVRRAAVGVLPRSGETRDTPVRTGLLRDSDAQVRLATLLALADLPADENFVVFGLFGTPGNTDWSLADPRGDGFFC